MDMLGGWFLLCIGVFNAFGGLFLWYSTIDKMQGAHATDEIVPANAYDIEGASLEEVQVSPGPREPHGHLRGLAWITSKVMP